MASHETPAQKETIGRVMHEYKHGELKRSRGGKVRNPKQAIAIALSEAGASNQQSPQENRRRLRQKKRKEAAGRTARTRTEGGTTRKELYAEAQKREVPGRSRMSKDQLARALHK